MYQPEVFRIGTSTMEPTYVYADPYASSVSYQYPYYTIVKSNGTCDTLLSETQAIRHDLNQIKSDISEIKQRQSVPTYYMVKQDYSDDTCPLCIPSSKNYQPQYSYGPIYYYDEYPRLVEERDYSAKSKVRTKTPTTTYQDSYKYPPPSQYFKRRITLNELQTQSPPSLVPAKHPRHWMPTSSKNTYPHRRWTLSEPHPEP